MKTIEQQKADLLQDYVVKLTDKINKWRVATLDERELVAAYKSIIAPKESTNPYIDEVFDMRICNVISDILNKEVKKIRISNCPHIKRLQNRKNIGIGSLQLYESVMQKYGLNEKLI